MSRFILDALRTAPNATAGPSRLPATRLRDGFYLVSETGSARLFSTSLKRRYATDIQPPVIPSPANPHAHPAFETLSNELISTQPCFGTRGDEVTLLTTPEQFKKTLLDMIKRAKRRILISSLYIGVEEVELVDAIKDSIKRNPHLRVVIMLDYHRSTRLSHNRDLPASTAHLLLPLLEKHHDRCEVWLFRSPKLRGLMERIVPERFDEGWGTWHGKWYGVDDEVILSGANLANSYFTNRQDRYIHFRTHPSLLSYLTSLTRLFTHYSYLLTPSPPPSVNRNHLVPLPSYPPTQKALFGHAALIWPQSSIHPRRFGPHAKATVTAFQNSWRSANISRLRRVDSDTYFWPVIQAGVLGLKEEEAALDLVWAAIKSSHAGDKPEPINVDLTSGYFGLYKAYKSAIINSPASIKVIAASPKANGFYGSEGLSGLIPEAYTLLESRFHRDAEQHGRGWDKSSGSGVRLKEWEREGWTYHAKGIWLSPHVPTKPTTIPSLPPPAGTPLPVVNSTNPFMTFVGSSNLSTRSLTLDAELSILLMTSSPSLRRALGAEVKGLDKFTSDVSRETFENKERKVGWMTKALVALGIDGML